MLKSEISLAIGGDSPQCACEACRECGALHSHWSGCSESTDFDEQVTAEYRRPRLRFDLSDL